MSYDLRQQILEATFKISKDAGQICDELKHRLRLGHNNEIARLCLGRSLAEPTPVQPLPATKEYNTPIRGKQLFDPEFLDLWLCIFIEAGNIGPNASLDLLRGGIEAHWDRGARLLYDDWKESGKSDVDFLIRVAGYLPDEPGSPDDRIRNSSALGAVRLSLGEISKSLPDNELISVVVNATSVAPHIALMGRNGSGKSRTGIYMAIQIQHQAQLPVLFLDPKGEFVDGKVVQGPLGTIPNIQGIELGTNPIPLDFLPSPDVGATAITKAALRFRDSLVRCTRGAGDVQKKMLLEATESCIKAGNRGLRDIHRAYANLLAKDGKGTDSVDSRLDELCRLNIFSPERDASTFFSTSWVVSLRGLPSDELRKLALLLILDALTDWSLRQPDSPNHSGHRTLRHLLVVDEARRVLAEKKYESLVDLVRQGRSKGQVVMFISQDPSDFQGQTEDFTSQLGIVLAFACNAQSGLSVLRGAYGRKVQPAEFSDNELEPFVAFAKLPNRQAEKIRCWPDPRE